MLSKVLKMYRQQEAQDIKDLTNIQSIEVIFKVRKLIRNLNSQQKSIEKSFKISE